MDRQVKVSRTYDVCGGCGGEPREVVSAYDDALWAGYRCPECILSGRAVPAVPVDHTAMRPMVFVAKALLGVEPMASMLKAADAQRKRPDVVRDEVVALARNAGVAAKKVAHDLNRRMRRANSAMARRAMKAIRAAKKKATAPIGDPYDASRDDSSETE